MRTVILICTIFCCTANAYDLNKYGTIGSHLFNVCGISIGDSYNIVIDALGEPVKEERVVNKYAEGKPVHLYYKGLYIFLSNDEVMNVSVTGKNIAMHGVTVGDGLEKVIKVFGSAKLQICKNQKCLRYIAKSKDGKLTDAQLIFLFKNRNVTEIILWYDFT